MNLNPFSLKAINIEECFRNWGELWSKPYSGDNPFCKMNILLATAVENQSIRLSHGFALRCSDNDLRRTLALLRRVEQQQQKKLAFLQPKDSQLQTAVFLEALTTELTAGLAQTETNKYIKSALDFALLEDFDHLYRFSTLLESEQSIEAARLLGGFVEIMPGRPTINTHRFPYDDVKRTVPFLESLLLSRINIMLISAVEGYAHELYSLAAGLHSSELGRKLFCEIAMSEEQHITQYNSLWDADMQWLATWLTSEYTECYMYYCLSQSEQDKRLKQLWKQHLEYEICHVRIVALLAEKYLSMNYKDILGDGYFPPPFDIERNIAHNRDYLRSVLKADIDKTAVLEDYSTASQLDNTFHFRQFNESLNTSGHVSPSHLVVSQYIAEFGTDYRFEDSPHPIKELRDRQTDNKYIGY